MHQASTPPRSHGRLNSIDPDLEVPFKVRDILPSLRNKVVMEVPRLLTIDILKDERERRRAPRSLTDVSFTTSSQGSSAQAVTASPQILSSPDHYHHSKRASSPPHIPRIH